MKLRILLVCCAALALTVGVATATAGNGDGGNSAAAKACQKGGWKNLVRSDGSLFKNQGDCVSYAAQGGTLKPKPTCTAGSENFSTAADNSTPTTFSGGTIDSAYDTTPAGVRIQGTSWNGTFAVGTHVLFTGVATSFKLSFTNAVNSVQLDAEYRLIDHVNVILTAFDASNSVVGSDSADGISVKTLSVTATENKIKYFTISNAGNTGEAFSNIVWGCAA
jgi:hypothetical protein